MRRTLIALAMWLTVQTGVQAQWGGFSTATGRGYEAYGMGAYAAGRGERNMMNSQARATNVNTNMQLNEYMYESLQSMNKAQMAAQAQENEDYTQALNRTQDRLRNNPTPEDIYKGDALNIALGELSDPRYYAHVAEVAANKKIPGRMIKILPFNDAADAVTFGLNQVTSAKPKPGSLMARPEFADLVAQYQKLGAKLNDEAKKTGDIEDETLQQFQAVIQKAIKRLEGMNQFNPADKAQVEMRLKALLNMSYMLSGQSLDVYLAELKGDESVGLDRLLAFMRSFNLRFGQAKNPNQKEAYDQLYPLLVELRTELFGDGTGTLPTDAPEPKQDDPRAMKAFGQLSAGMSPGLQAPAPPAPGGR